MLGKVGIDELSDADARRFLIACPDDEFVPALEEVLKRHRSHGWLTLHHAADLADMSVRSFQRRLAEQGETFAHIAEVARTELAERLLKCTELSLAEIASALGYTQPTNFVRAFKRWTGKTPDQFRVGG